MDDRAWERLRRRDKVDRFMSSMSMVSMYVSAVLMALAALHGDTSVSVFWLADAIGSAVLAHWQPALVKIINSDEDS